MVLKNKTKIKTKPKTKTKPKPKNKQNQIQKQSQNVVVNIHETKKKQTKRKPNKKNDEKETNSGSGGSSAVYAIPDNRAIDTLRGELVNTQNKLLSITNTPNMVNMRQNGDESFSNSNNRLRSIEGNNKNSTTPYKIEEGKQYKSNILGDEPYIISNDFKIKKPRGKNKAKITELTEDELRSEKAPEKEPPKEMKKEDLDSFVIDEYDEELIKQERNSERIRKRTEEKRKKEEQIKAEKKAMEDKKALEEKKASQKKAKKVTKEK